MCHFGSIKNDVFLCKCFVIFSPLEPQFLKILTWRLFVCATCWNQERTEAFLDFLEPHVTENTLANIELKMDGRVFILGLIITQKAYKILFASFSLGVRLQYESVTCTFCKSTLTVFGRSCWLLRCIQSECHHASYNLCFKAKRHLTIACQCFVLLEKKSLVCKHFQHF